MRNAGRIAATLRQRYGKDRVKIVISRYDKQAEIGSEDVERVVGSPVDYTVPSDYRAALTALNKGRPLALDKDSKLAAGVPDHRARPGRHSRRAGRRDGKERGPVRLARRK